MKIVSKKCFIGVDIRSNIDYYSNYRNQHEEVKNIMVLNVKDFPDGLHRQAKIQAAIMGISLKELIIRAITEYLKNEKKKGG